jgi:hypothetical protein
MGLNEQIRHGLSELENAERSLKPMLVDVGAKAGKLLDSAMGIEQSWSGSYCGYHSELYYGNFERPPVGERFSPEWGGLYGIPAGYRPRAPEEVQARVEALVV